MGSEDPKEMIARHLFEAIDQARDDLAKVEFWASAVSGFSRPVPDYHPGSTTMWLPREQAVKLRNKPTS